NAEFANNFFIEFLGNSDLFVNTVNWLAREPQAIAHRPHHQELGLQQFYVSAEEGDAVFWAAAVIEPAIFAVIGLVLSVRRRWRGGAGVDGALGRSRGSRGRVSPGRAPSTAPAARSSGAPALSAAPSGGAPPGAPGSGRSHRRLASVGGPLGRGRPARHDHPPRPDRGVHARPGGRRADRAGGGERSRPARLR